MNKVIAGIVIAIIAVSGAFIAFGGESDTTVSDNQTTEQATDSTAANQPSADQADASEASTQDTGDSSGQSLGYVDFSEEKLAEAAGSERIVFFHATWCSTCNFFEGQIESEGVPAGITVLKADFDNDTALKERYGVSVQSTFVLLDENGDVAETWPFASGLRSIQDLYNAVI